MISTKGKVGRSGRSPLAEINNTVHQRVDNHRAALALPTYSASQPPAQSFGTGSLSTAAQAAPSLSSTRMNIPEPRPRSLTANPSTSSGISKSNDTGSTEELGFDTEELGFNMDGQSVDEEAEDRPSHRQDEEDWDDGMSDAYVPSDVGRDQDRDGVRLRESSDHRQDTEANGNETESGAEEMEEDAATTVKIRTRRNSKKTKKSQPKASDYGEDVEAMLNHAAGLMRALVMSEKPMPSIDESIDLASDAYELTKMERPHVQPPSDVKYIPIVS